MRAEQLDDRMWLLKPDMDRKPMDLFASLRSEGASPCHSSWSTRSTAARLRSQENRHASRLVESVYAFGFTSYDPRREALQQYARSETVEPDQLVLHRATDLVARVGAFAPQVR